MSDFNDYLNKAKDLADDASEGAKDFDFSVPGCPPSTEDIYQALKLYLSR